MNVIIIFLILFFLKDQIEVFIAKTKFINLFILEIIL